MLLPPICVACGQPAGTETLPVGTSDWNGKHMITLQFPLCAECGAVRVAGAGMLGGLSRRKLMKNDPAQRERFDQMMHAVKLKGYRPTAFRSVTSDSITVELANPAFAAMFAVLNGVGPVSLAGPAEPAPQPQVAPVPVPAVAPIPPPVDAPQPVPARPDQAATPIRPDRAA
jgi:hypothetical protein